MAAIADLSDLLNRSSGGASGAPENIFFYKVARVAGAAAPAVITGRMHSLWQYERVDGVWRKSITRTRVSGTWMKAHPVARVDGEWKFG